MTPKMKQQMMWEHTVNVHGKPGENVSMDLHMNKECKQAMGSLGLNIGDKAVSRIGWSIGEMMKVIQQFDSINKLHDHSGHPPSRSIQLDMEKLLEQLQGGNVFGHISSLKFCTWPPQNWTKFSVWVAQVVICVPKDFHPHCLYGFP